MDIDFIRFTQSLVSAINQTMKIIFHGATPIGFVILMCFQHFINSSLPFPIYEIIFYTDSVYPRCWKNFVFINFSNIRDKAGKEFLFISWQYHGNLSISLKRGMYYAHKAYHTGTTERFESRRKKNVIAGIV